MPDKAGEFSSMKNLPKFLVVAAAASALLFLTGCPKKPDRSAPLDTTIGQQTQDTSVIPTDLVADQGSTLVARDPLPPGWSEEGPGYRVDALQSVYFGFDRAAISADQRPKIEAAATWLKGNADKNIVLEGHCDWRGTAEYNLGLGDRRAAAVKRWLESLGIEAKRLEIISRGDIDAKEGASEAEMAKDRRVDFFVLKPQ
jgi:peptidoglycan-associated lipoprotein